jgi:hypothetical protein
MSNGQQQWSGRERRHAAVLDESTIEMIAEKAADRAVEKLTGHIYKEIGKGVVTKTFWVVGALVAGALLWLKANGYLK